MKYIGFHLPCRVIKDMNYISKEIGMSKDQMVRIALSLVIEDFYEIEALRNQDIEDHKRKTTHFHGDGSISLPDT